MRLTKISLWIFLSTLLGNSFVLTAQVCDRTKEYWLDSSCNMPSKENPDHACRYQAYMKANGINPQDTSLNIRAGSTTLPSYESMADDLCNSLKSIRCADATLALYKRYNAIQGSTLTKPREASERASTSPRGLLEKFEDISSRNLTILKTVENISRRYRTVSFNPGVPTRDLYKKEEELRSEYEKLRGDIRLLSENEQVFLSVLDGFVAALTLNAESTLNLTAGFDCDFQNSYLTTDYNDDLKDLVDTLNAVKKETLEGAKERNSLVRLTFLKNKYAIYSSYSATSNKSLSTLLEELNRDLWLSRTMLEFADWWTSITVNGLANGLHTQFYYYSEPLRILKSNKETALKFKDAIRSNPLFNENIGEIALKSIDERIKTIDSNISFIESRGWKGLLEVQLATAKKRAELLPNNKNCIKAIKDFQDRAAKVNDVPSFDVTARYYRVSVEACKK